MLPEDDLKSKAITDCKVHIDGMLRESTDIETIRSEINWDSRELRLVFEQHMVIWKNCSEFEVLLDQNNRPVGYIDDDKIIDCKWQEIDRERVVELASNTGFIPPESSIISMTRGEGGCIEVVLNTQPDRPDSPRYIARINPSRERVICIMPEGAVL